MKKTKKSKKIVKASKLHRIKKENKKIRLSPPPQIKKIKLLGNSREIRKPAPLMRLPTFKNVFSLPKIKSPCEQRKERRRVLFETKKAGKIKVHFAKWTLKSLIRC